jgi:sensor histidine kinase YesM
MFWKSRVESVNLKDLQNFSEMREKTKYWLFQFIGWLTVAFVQLLFAFFYAGLSREFVYRIFFFAAIGLLSSHVIKLIVLRVGILSGKVLGQIAGVVALVLAFALIDGAIYYYAILSFWNIPASIQQVSTLLRITNYAFNFGIFLGIWSCFYLIHHYIKGIRNEEREKLVVREQLVELEAKALRSQMNPHFIFNCLNSIKSLIQEEKKEASITYLTTFSKLIRTLFNNADKKEISLFDELETCKFYLKLESLRFDNKFTYSISANENVDLKAVQIPALIIQPFIENAIWHGIVPSPAGGHIDILVNRDERAVDVIIEDNGIGRNESQTNKPVNELWHQSRGVHLTQSRLQLDGLIRNRDASVKIIDKKDVLGKALGTKVILSLKENI